VADKETILRENFGKNLAKYRKAAGLTQLQLAEKLNYTDKSISKWERGDGLPDVIMMSAIAEIFNVTIDDLLNEKPAKRPATNHNKIMTTIIAAGGTWLVGLMLFVFFTVVIPGIFKEWLFFIYSITAMAIVLIVFSSVWWGKLFRFLSVSLLIWSIPLCLVLSIPVPKISLLFTVAGVVQVLTVFGFLIKKNKDN